MKNFVNFFCLAAALLAAGCVWLNDRRDAGTAAPAAEKTGAESFEAARLSFQQDLEAAPGLNLAQLKKLWGPVRRSVAHNDLTVYLWSRTVSVSPPPDMSELLDAVEGRALLSCQAWFIVDKAGLVVEATSKGRCLDYSLLQDWRPTPVKVEAEL